MIYLYQINDEGVGIMRITITGRNIELTEGLKAAVEDKLGKLERYFTPDTEVYVTLSVEKERQKIEVTIPAKGNYIRSTICMYPLTLWKKSLNVS